MGDQVGTLAVPAAAADSAFGPLGGHAGQQQVMLQAGAGPLPGLTAARMEVCLQPQNVAPCADSSPSVCRVRCAHPHLAAPPVDRGWAASCRGARASPLRP